MKGLPPLVLATLLAGCVGAPPSTPGPEDFRVYRGDGSPASLDELYQALRAVNVGFLGESHNDTVAHSLQERILRDTWDSTLALSLEMFETDVQLVLNEYLAGLIDAERLRGDARAWDNYPQAYAPLVDFAKAQGLPVLAANAPRRYVSLVGREGAAALQQLSPEALRWLPPLPYPPASPAYRAKFLTLMGETLPAGSHGAAAAADAPGSPDLTPAQTESAAASAGPIRSTQDQAAATRPSPPDSSAGAGPAPELSAQSSPDTTDSPDAADSSASPPDAAQDARLARSLEAQSLWDATMAWSIATWLDSQAEGRVLQVNGSFHSEGRLGIVERLDDYRPGTTALVITLQPSATFPAFDVESMSGLGDFVIVTPLPPR